MIRVSLPILALLAQTISAHAASEDAWAQFRADVDTACRALVQDPGEVAVEVNPFGTENYGVALVTLTSEAGTDRMVCVFDKKTKLAELSAPFTPEP